MSSCLFLFGDWGGGILDFSSSSSSSPSSSSSLSSRLFFSSCLISDTESILWLETSRFFSAKIKRQQVLVHVNEQMHYRGSIRFYIKWKLRLQSFLVDFMVFCESSVSFALSFFLGFFSLFSFSFTDSVSFSFSFSSVSEKQHD